MPVPNGASLHILTTDPVSAGVEALAGALPPKGSTPTTGMQGQK